MAGVVGDFRALEALATILGRAGPEAVSNAIKAIAADAVDLVAEGFRSSKTPDGTPWRPLAKARRRNKKKGDRGKPLMDTGRLRASVTTSPAITGDGFVISSNLVYAATHQIGRGGIPARPFLPVPELPAEWLRRFEVIAREEVDGVFEA